MLAKPSPSPFSIAFYDPKRKNIVEWSNILKSSSGAIYLKEIINFTEKKSDSPPVDFLKVNKF